MSNNNPSTPKTPRQIIEATEVWKQELSKFEREILGRYQMILRIWDNYLKAKSLGDITKVGTYPDMGKKEKDIINELLKTNETLS